MDNHPTSRPGGGDTQTTSCTCCGQMRLCTYLDIQAVAAGWRPMPFCADCQVNESAFLRAMERRHDDA